MHTHRTAFFALPTTLLLLSACADPAGTGTPGTDGIDGLDGTDGTDGTPGSAGADGSDGSDGTSPCLDVRAYGAVGDGVSDDAPAIQAAVDDLPTWTGYEAGAGGRVCLPEGTFLVGEGILLPDFVQVVGEGMYSTLLVADRTKEPLSVFARQGTNAVKNTRIADLGVSITDPESVAFDLRHMTRTTIERTAATNPAFVYGDDSAPPAGTGVWMQAGDGLSGYDNRIDNNEMWGMEVGVYIGPDAHASTITRNTITGGDYGVYIEEQSGSYTDNTRVTHNRFEAMRAAFLYMGGQAATVEHNRFEAYDGEPIEAAILFPVGSRWNDVLSNYVSLASTPAYEVLDEGTNNSWQSWYTKVLSSRVSGDHLEQRVVRIGDDLPRGLTIDASYLELGQTVRLASDALAVASGDTIDPSTAVHLHLSGSATGVTIGTTGVAQGTLLMLTASSGSVAIGNGSTADIAGSSVTLGGSSGTVSGITLIYASSGRWQEVSRGGTRP
jgi:Pectate lyase superfamily protein